MKQYSLLSWLRYSQSGAKSLEKKLIYSFNFWSQLREEITKIISFEKLLEVFFYTHDPTTINRQGNDIGTQYRSVVFYHNNNQKKISEEFIKDLEEKKFFKKPIVTQIIEYKNFYIAEDYHKNYFDNNKNAPYCSLTIMPKINKLIDKFNDQVKEEYK